MYVVFFNTSKSWFKLKYIYAMRFKHAEQTNGNKYMSNVTLFHNFADSSLQNGPFFLISRIRASHWKISGFFFSQKWVRAWYTFWSGGGRVLPHEIYVCSVFIIRSTSPSVFKTAQFCGTPFRTSTTDNIKYFCLHSLISHSHDPVIGNAKYNIALARTTLPTT